MSDNLFFLRHKTPKSEWGLYLCDDWLIGSDWLIGLPYHLIGSWPMLSR